MADEIDIEEHDVLESLRRRQQLEDPDVTIVKSEPLKVGYEESNDEESNYEWESDKQQQPMEIKVAPHTDNFRFGKIILGSKSNYEWESDKQQQPMEIKVAPHTDNFRFGKIILGSKSNYEWESDKQQQPMEIKVAPHADKFRFGKIILGSKPAEPENHPPTSDIQLDEENYNYNMSLVLDDWGPMLDNSDCYCKECRILFATVNALDAHTMIAHSFLVTTDEQPSSPERNKPIKSTAKPAAIINQGRDRNEGSTCGICNKNYAGHRSNLRRHYRTEHQLDQMTIENNMDSKTWRMCNHCKKYFPDDTSLVKHLYELLPKGNTTPTKDEKKSAGQSTVKTKPALNVDKGPKANTDIKQPTKLSNCLKANKMPRTKRDWEEHEEIHQTTGRGIQTFRIVAFNDENDTDANKTIMSYDTENYGSNSKISFTDEELPSKAPLVNPDANTEWIVFYKCARPRTRRVPSPPPPAPPPPPPPSPPRRSLPEETPTRRITNKTDPPKNKTEVSKNKTEVSKNKTEVSKNKTETPKNKTDAQKQKAETPKTRTEMTKSKTETPNDTPVSKEKKAPPAKKKGELQTLLEDSLKYDETLLAPRSLKRTREEPPRPALLPKRAKPVPLKQLKEPSPPLSRAGPKSRNPGMLQEPDNIPVPLKVPKPKAKPETPKIENTSESSRSSSVSSLGRASRPRTRRVPSPPPPAPPPPPPPSPPRRSLPEETPTRRITNKTDPPKNKTEVSKNKTEVSKNKTEVSKNKTETPKNKTDAQKQKAETPKTRTEMTKSKTETPNDTPVSKEKKAPPAKKKGELQTLLEDSLKYDETLLAPRSLKRTREEPPRPALLPKRAKPVPLKQLKEPSPPLSRAGPKSRNPGMLQEPDNIPVPLKVPKPKAKPETPKIENTSESSRSSSVSSLGRASRPRTRRVPSPPPPAPPPPPPPSPPRRSLPEETPTRRITNKTDPPKNKTEVSKNKTEVSKNKTEVSKNKTETPKNKTDAQKQKAETPKTRTEMTKSKTETPNDTPVSKEKKAPPAKKKGELQTLLEDSLKYDETLLAPRSLKRTREEPPRPALLPKRAKPVPLKQLKEPSPPLSRAGPKSRNPGMLQEPDNIPVPLKVPKPKAKPETPKPKKRGRPKGSTNKPKPPGAPRDFKTLQLYDEHIEKGLCVGDELLPVKCDEQLRAAHKCPGVAAGPKPGGKCSACSRTYATAKTLKKHESQCSQKKKGGDLIADPDVLRRLKPMQVRIYKCDGLLASDTAEHSDVSRVKPNYGLAKNYIYPYFKMPVKRETLHALKKEFIHWDSDDIDDNETESVIKRVPSLSTLAIKKLFTKELLGKVPRKRKNVNNETSEADKNETKEAFMDDDFGDVSNDINDIINSMDDMRNGVLDRRDLQAKINDIVGCFDDSADVLEGDDNKTTVDVEASNDKESENQEHSEKADENQDDNGKASDSNAELDTGSNENESTNVNKVESNERINSNEESSNFTVNCGEGNSDTVIEKNQINIGVENDNLNRLDTEISLEKSIDNKSKFDAATSREPDNINGFNNHKNEEDSFKVVSKNNDDNEEKKEESKQIIKESPIKHSIENLIGESDKNPDKYISKVISSIENIIMNNPRNDEINEDQQTNSQDDVEMNDNSVMGAQEESVSDQGKRNEEVNQNPQTSGQNDMEMNDDSLMDALDEHIAEKSISYQNKINDEISQEHQTNGQDIEMDDNSLMDALDELIGEKRISDQDKITLEDLLPKENRCEELKNISDEDLNFDA